MFFGLLGTLATVLAAPDGPKNVTTIDPKSAAIVGTVLAGKECESGGIVAWLSKTRMLLYQMDVVPKGSFEFHVLPGVYNLVFTSGSGCFVEDTIKAQAGQVVFSQVNLSKGNRKPAFFDSMCPTCGMTNNFGMMPMVTPNMMTSFYPSTYPSWGPYGAMTYNNFYGSPFMMNGWGVNGGFYPGGGRLVGAKPNVYVEGPSGSAVSVKVKPVGSNSILAASPVHGTQGWEGTLTTDRLFQVGGGKNPYLFYDIRIDETKLQDSSGFCTDREQVLARISETLRRGRFLASEVEDFDEYWNVKMPHAQSLCVFPQQGAETEQFSTYEVKPAPILTTRLFFVVVPEPLMSQIGGRKFSKKPTKDWVFEAPRVPASTGVSIREWGLGFLTL
jgi:hypothetical protein